MYYGEKVCLRAYKEEDIKLAAEFMNDKELQRFLNPRIPLPISVWQEEEWIKAQKINENGTSNFAIEDIKTKQYIGGCGINEVNWLVRTADVGIWVCKECWGKGYGTDAMKVLLKFIFENMNMNKVKLSTFSFNERAKKSYEKCGFKVEGILKDEVFKDGKYYDEILMAIFKDEFEK